MLGTPGFVLPFSVSETFFQIAKNSAFPSMNFVDATPAATEDDTAAISVTSWAI